MATLSPCFGIDAFILKEGQIPSKQGTGVKIVSFLETYLKIIEENR